jgi:hypothetical protein
MFVARQQGAELATLVIIQHLLLPVQIHVEPDIVWQLYDGRCPDVSRTYRRGDRGSRRRRFASGWPIIILSENVETQKGEDICRFHRRRHGSRYYFRFLGRGSVRL